jgi:hypothetical protein
MMYNGISSGMNAHMWAPCFALLTIYDLTRALEVGTFMANSSIGEMFFLISCWRTDALAWQELISRIACLRVNLQGKVE